VEDHFSEDFWCQELILHYQSGQQLQRMLVISHRRNTGGTVSPSDMVEEHVIVVRIAMHLGIRHLDIVDGRRRDR